MANKKIFDMGKNLFDKDKFSRPSIFIPKGFERTIADDIRKTFDEAWLRGTFAEEVKPDMKENFSNKFKREYGNVIGGDTIIDMDADFTYEDLIRAMQTGIGRAERFKPENNEVIDDAIFEEVK
jgi:hypothetical protein